MEKVLSLIKRRGFIFTSSPLYGSRGLYDYGPLGAMVKANLRDLWWRDSVTSRDDVLPVETCILTAREALRASGHLEHFTDPLTDCRLSGQRFRTDKAPPLAYDRETGRVDINASSNAEVSGKQENRSLPVLLIQSIT